MDPVLIVVILLILAAEFVNGWTDAPNAIATVVSTRVMSRGSAVAMAVVFNVIGVFSGTAVAATIGKGIVDSGAINLPTIGAALLGIIIWSSVAARFGMPTSESHALVAGLAGASLAVAGPEALLWEGWRKVLIGLFLSGVVGFLFAFFFTRLVRRAVASSPPSSTGKSFRRWQIITAAFMAFNHGSNDGQKFIGVFALVLLLGGVTSTFQVPIWVVLVCALVMGLGTSVGGWKIIQEMGMKMVDLRPWQGFCAQVAAGGTIFFASRFGIPLSTTHTIITSMMGVAASRKLRHVRWDIAGHVALAWVLTFPICGAIAYVAAYIVKRFFG
ncbi:MAG TPA: inorganic phosphate transporter [bacterium]|nr:inorganic phosphate transporter [bacterium]